MLQKKIVDKILDFVRTEPRTIQDIATLLRINWRTADRYVDQISVETGMIRTKVYREGTRGALKIVYWNALEPGRGTAFQEKLLHTILTGKRKEDFSAFDVFQFVDAKQRELIRRSDDKDYTEIFAQAQQNILCFSGNLSWFDASFNKKKLERLSTTGGSIKILTRVDVVSQERVRELLAYNKRFGRDIVQIRHCEQPVRGAVIDENVLSLKEVLTPQQHRELSSPVYLFYLISDKEWILWAQRVFWQLWNQSVDAEARLHALKSLALS